MYAQDSIELLKQSGINFAQNEARGIEVQRFGEVLMSSGIVLNDEVRSVPQSQGPLTKGDASCVSAKLMSTSDHRRLCQTTREWCHVDATLNGAACAPCIAKYKGKHTHVRECGLPGQHLSGA